MNIASKSSYPAGSLSNFAPHPFTIDGVECASMEGFLQSLKFKCPDNQRYICTLVGSAAKIRGKHKKWWKTQKLYWMGVEYDRDSDAYQELLDRAYDCLAKNEGFKRALLATKSATLTHAMGQRKTSKTVLTEREFCSRLTKLRNRLQLEK